MNIFFAFWIIEGGTFKVMEVLYDYIILTLYGLNSFLCRFSGHNLKYALFVYRLIGAILIWNFFDGPFLKLNRNYGEREPYGPPCR